MERLLVLLAVLLVTAFLLAGLLSMSRMLEWKSGNPTLFRWAILLVFVVYSVLWMIEQRTRFSAPPPGSQAIPVSMPTVSILDNPKAVGALQTELPKYPVSAIQERITGTVRMTLFVDDAGHISKIKTIEGPRN